MVNGRSVIEWLARQKKLFRERDVRAQKASTGCLEEARVFRIATPHGHGVWSHPHYVPTRYELLQLRFRKAVFWGPSALWLLGAAQQEPDELWIAIANGSRVPRAIDLSTVVIRTRNLESDVVKLKPEGRVQELRVHSLERATKDAANIDRPGLIARSLERRDFVLAPDAEFLSANLPPNAWWRPPHASEARVREDWSVARSLPRAHESRGPGR